MLYAGGVAQYADGTFADSAGNTFTDAICQGLESFADNVEDPEKQKNRHFSSLAQIVSQQRHNMTHRQLCESMRCKFGPKHLGMRIGRSRIPDVRLQFFRRFKLEGDGSTAGGSDDEDDEYPDEDDNSGEDDEDGGDGEDGADGGDDRVGENNSQDSIFVN